MPKAQEPVQAARDRWILLNDDAAIDAISFAVIAGECYILGTVNASYPLQQEVGWPYNEGEGELQKPLTELFYTTSVSYVWARARGSDDVVIVVDYLDA